MAGSNTEVRMSDEICLVLTTCPDEKSAERLAEVLVEQRLAACVSAGSPAVSTYPWQGRIEREREIPLTIKTARSRVPVLTETLVAHHPYEVPEVLVLPVVGGLDAYMQWIRDWLQ
jgi:periplasmic divalent cation tolerance protein